MSDSTMSNVVKRDHLTYDGMNPPKHKDLTPRQKRRDAHVDAWAFEVMSRSDYVRFCGEVGHGNFWHAREIIDLYGAWPWQRLRFRLWANSHT